MMKPWMLAAVLTLSSALFGSQVVEVRNLKQLQEEIQNSQKLLFVDCYSTYCGPCKVVSFLFDQWAEDLQSKGKFVKIDLSHVSELYSQYQIRSIPTVLIFDSEGKLKDKKVGVDEIMSYFNTLKL